MGSKPGEFEFHLPFVIDGEGYSDRDRAMFVAGYEFCYVATMFEQAPGQGFTQHLHRENEDRIRVLCTRFNRTYTLEPIDKTWMCLTVDRR